MARWTRCLQKSSGESPGKEGEDLLRKAPAMMKNNQPGRGALSTAGVFVGTYSG